MSKFSLSIPKMGYILLYRSKGSFIDKIIVKKQLAAGLKLKYAQYVHMEVAGPKTQGKRYSIKAAPPIAKMVDIAREHKGKYLCVLRYDNEHYERIGRFKIAWFAATRCNKPYDIPGILAFIFKWMKQDNRFWFCSEGGLWAFKMEYPLLTAMLPHKCMPGHFFTFEEMKVHWEGIIE